MLSMLNIDYNRSVQFTQTRRALKNILIIIEMIVFSLKRGKYNCFVFSPVVSCVFYWQTLECVVS